MKGKELKYDIKKSFFGITEMEYLGFWITCDGVNPKIKNTSNKYIILSVIEC